MTDRNKLIDDALHSAMNRVRDLGFDPVYAALYGSQNYEMDLYTPEYQSDFDVRVMVVPYISDLIKEKKISCTEAFTDGYEEPPRMDYGLIDIKDVNTMMRSVFKMNPTYMEVFLTPHYICANKVVEKRINEIRAFMPKMILERAPLFVKACCGMYLEKAKKIRTVSPATAERIRAYGYDGKQASSMERLFFLLRDYYETGEINLVPDSTAKEYLLALKKNEIPDEYVDLLFRKKEMSILKELCEEKFGTEVQDSAMKMIQFVSETSQIDYIRDRVERNYGNVWVKC